MSEARSLLPRRARRLMGYWRAERRTLRQGLVALLLSTAASFVAGLTLAALVGTFTDLPGLFILIPASVGMRGVISGTAGARLGTSIAAGLFEVSWRRGGVLRQNAEIGLVLTVITSIYVALLARLAAGIFGEPSIPLIDLVTISVVGGTVGAAIVLVATIGFAVVCFHRGYDLDAVATPVITAVGDMVTLPALAAAAWIVEVEAIRSAVGFTCLAAGAIAFAIALRAEPVIRRVFLEMLVVLLSVPILDVLAGTLLESRAAVFLAYPGLLLLIPPFISQAGALGGILSSRLSSKLVIGVITPSGRPERPALVDGSLVVVFGAAIFTVIGVAGAGLAGVTGDAIPGAAATITATITAGVIVLPLVLVLGYYLAVGTTRFGLDPDNLTVPLISGVMDLVGIATLILAMSLWGVPIHA